MRQVRLFSVAILTVVAILFFASGCSDGSSTSNSMQSTTVEVTDVKPVVKSVEVVNTGMQDKYYAILNITVKNDGADGMVIITGSVTQGTQTPITSEMPVYLIGDSEQVIRMVLPLKWGSGEPKAKAEVRIP